MNKDLLTEKYNLWCSKAVKDNLQQELSAISAHEKKIEDAFYRELEFGTGGLRGVIGAGTNRMNVYTVAKASQGLARYILASFDEPQRKIAVSYDCRIKSDLFAKTAAGVFAANGIKVYIYDRLMPTPCLSFAVRRLGCCGGVMITASHNPAKYNGYKVYGADGCQITTDAADEILNYINETDVFSGVNSLDFDCGLRQGKIEYIPENVYDEYIYNVRQQTITGSSENISKNVSIVYTPLNGTGLKPVLRALTQSGFEDITVVKQQELPDGNFTTCPYPNPEIPQAMELGIECAQQKGAQLLLATDPDCDRVGIAVKNNNGSFTLISGNEVGMLLLDFILSRRTQKGTMPTNPVFIKTIVTTDLAKRIAENYGVKTIEVLTGFKFIGEQIGFLEKEGRSEDYIFGFEESYGYLAGTYVRDKDAVVASLLICEMFAYYVSKNKTLLDRLEEIYQQYGYCLNTLHSFEFEGADGAEKMRTLMESFRGEMTDFGGFEIVKTTDYKNGIGTLPKADVLKYTLQDNCSLIIRPSGTEPKLKLYISITAQSRALAEEKEAKIAAAFAQLLK